MQRAAISMLIISFILSIASSANAAQLIYRDIQEDDAFCPHIENELCYAVEMNGPIEKGDTTKIENLIGSMRKMNSGDLHTFRLGSLTLNSEGGDVHEAMNIGRILRKYKVQISVTFDAKCYSACVLILAGGVARTPLGAVGIHSFYSSSSKEKSYNYEQEDNDYKLVSQEIEAYLREMRVSVRLLDEMMNTPESTIRTLTPDELRDLSLLGIDPIFRQYLTANGYLTGTETLN